MKKHFIIFFLLIVLFGAFLLTKIDLAVSSSTQELHFAKVEKSTIFYDFPSKVKEDNQKFILEETYFVKVLGEEKEFFYVNYLNLKGYVLKENLELVNEKIEKPFLKNVTFTTTKKTYLYSRPKFSENLVLENINEKENILYIGKIFGESIDESGNVWYYSCLQKNGKEIYGYIHSSFTNNLSPITENQEISTKLISNVSNTYKLLSLDFNSQGMIILIISVPLFLLFFLFTKGFKKIK